MMGVLVDAGAWEAACLVKGPHRCTHGAEGHVTTEAEIRVMLLEVQGPPRMTCNHQELGESVQQETALPTLGSGLLF